MQLRKHLLVLILLFFISNVQNAQQSDPPFLKYMNHPWVDSVLNTLSLDQQIAQCIWIAGYSNRDISHAVEVADIIRKYGIGGIIFFQGTADKQAELTNFYQKISKVPLLISLDAEWGIGMRLDNVDKFPYQMTLGAIKNDSLIYRFGEAIAAQFKRLGMQMNLAPVADININPQNPVINYRSFGENRYKVAEKSSIYMKGMQDNGILATGKHFPGHGDTNVDSHLDLPVISYARERFDSIELFPFRRLISEGTGSIMIAHLNLPLIDTITGLPSTLSPVIVRNLLRNDLGFKGLVITDAMNMSAITKSFHGGEADAKAFAAGNDVVEFVADVDSAIRETKNYILQKKITNEDISLKCRKILALKYWSGLNKVKVIKRDNIDKELSPMISKALIRELYSDALTVLKNNQDILPLKNLQSMRVATVAINRNRLTIFQQRISKYHHSDHFFLDPSNIEASNDLIKKLSGYDVVIAGVFGLDQRPNMDFGIKPGLIDFIGKLVEKNNTIITWFGNPYGLDKIKSLQNAAGLILAYQENENIEDISAQIIFGGIGASGSLPVTINDTWPAGYGLVTKGNIRLQYGVPESAGVSSETLNRKIDSLVNAGLTAKAYPGCEVMIARKGVVIFQKTYGYQTYDNRVAVQEDDLYDLASVTKVSSTLPCLMILDGEGKFSPDATLGSYLPYYKHSNKSDLRLSDMLTHQAGLTSWIPFWKETVRKNGKFKKNIFKPEYSEKYPVEVARGLYLNKNYRKKIFTQIKKSPLGERKYLYSDLTFIIAPDIIDKLSGQKWYDFVNERIYEKIGASDMAFNPYLKYPLSRIVPTEYDSLFRKQLLHGTVHDEGAAMLGGISGQAGLFSTANDLMKVLELYRRMGEYGGEQLISREVMERYTRAQFPENGNRRGLGFDKPLLNNSEVSQKESYPTRSASPTSFGHSGFTGTFVWVDPATDISYIFLSNRVYPTRDNNKIADMNIRTEILQAIYDSILK
jgi:beta-N-acetylhexosaminidase